MTRNPCCACGPFKPKWMRMVDNIYGTSQDGSNHSKLIFFCVRKPDKLDRIAGYLHQRLASDLGRRNYNYVNQTMEAINSLLNACHAQRLNMFVVSFLKMVQLLLETGQPHLQIIGTKSFIEFSQIEEDTPNYHREFDDLINHFSTMCHSNLSDQAERPKVRVAGIQGIQGIIRKTTTDQLQVNIFQAECVDKIIPSLLFNIQGDISDEDTHQEGEDPSKEAVFAFKDVICRASYGNMKPVIRSILIYFDQHKLWTSQTYPLLIFEMLLDSIKNSQSAHNVVKQLVEHLGQHETDLTPQERTGIIRVINKAVICLAKEAIGPDVFHNFKSLLQMLRSSIDKTSGSKTSVVNEEEKQFQNGIVDTIAEFAKNLPDTQKIEIMKFILNFDPMVNDRAECEKHKPLIKVLLKTMLTVATQYKTVAISKAFNTDFLNLLLRGSAIDPDPTIRLIVQQILHTLIDRHENSARLLPVRIFKFGTLKDLFKWEKPTRQDIMFMKKTGSVLIENLYQQFQEPSNTADNLEHLWMTMCLMALEMGEEQVIVELFRLVLMTQKFATDSDMKIPLTQRCAIHALLASFLSLLVDLAKLPGLQEHISGVIVARSKTNPALLPDMALNRQNSAQSYPTTINFTQDILFSEKIISEQLKKAKLDVSTLTVPFTKAGISGGGSKYSGQRKFSTFGYMSDLQCINNDMSASASNFSLDESVPSTPEMDRKNDIDKDDIDLSFDALKKILHESTEVRRQKQEEEEKRLVHYFKTAAFEDICREQKEKSFPMRANLNDVLDTLGRNIEKGTLFEHQHQQKPLPIWEIDFPPLFVS